MKHDAAYERDKYTRAFKQHPGYGCTGHRFCKQLAALSGKSVAALDVGAGNGAMATYLRDRG